MLAVMRSTAILAVSEGWNEKGPRGIQRCAPQREAASPEIPGISTMKRGTRQAA
jgi:hypothetical protein